VVGIAELVEMVRRTNFSKVTRREAREIAQWLRSVPKDHPKLKGF
jgi:hypothetical protein